MRRALTAVFFACLCVPVAAQAPDEARLARIRELVALMEQDAAFRVAVDAILGQQRHAELARLDAAAAQSPESAAAVARQKEQLERMYARLDELLAKHLDLDGFREEVLVPLYARHFTSDEVESLLVFYRSPVGQKLVKMLPDLMQESSEASTRYFAPALAKVQEELLGDVAKKGEVLRTMAAMRTLATELEIARTEHGRLPAITTVGEVAALTEDADRLEANDAWGHPFLLVIGEDGMRYRVVSGGRDGTIDEESRVLAAPGQPPLTHYSDAAGADLVYEGNDTYESSHFVRLPAEVADGQPVRR